MLLLALACAAMLSQCMHIAVTGLCHIERGDKKGREYRLYIGYLLVEAFEIIYFLLYKC